MTTGDLAIRAKDISKTYRIYQNPVDPFIELLTKKTRHIPRKALHQVNLELNRGEIVGILGRNGAGKSTLLKIIAGTLESNQGELQVNGRITAILELGTGFHPEYSGRENIYMGGLCLGMPRNEIESKIDSIIEFSELEKVIDQPFKTYSTGMQARLTFSTAISVDPDILIIDEALSVGDAKFQMKCFTWLRNLRKKNATILIVSHDTNTVTTICDRAIILENGTIYAEGDAGTITETYHNLLFGSDDSNNTDSRPENKTLTTNSTNFKALDINKVAGNHSLSNIESDNGLHKKTSSRVKLTRYGSGDVKLLSWGIYNENKQPVSVILSGDSFKLEMSASCIKDQPSISCGFAIKDRRGTVQWGVTNLSYHQKELSLSSGSLLNVTCSGTMWLAAGEYFVTLGIAHAGNGNKIDFIENALEFRVTGTEKIFTTSAVNLDSDFKISIDNSQ